MTAPIGDLLFTKDWKKRKNYTLRNRGRQRNDKQNELYYTRIFFNY